MEKVNAVTTLDGVAVTLRLPVVLNEIYSLKYIFGLPHHISGNEFIVPSLDASSIGYNIRERQYFLMNHLNDFCKKGLYNPQFICVNVQFKQYTPKDCILRDIEDKSRQQSTCPTHQLKLEGGIFFQEIFHNIWFFYVGKQQQAILNCGKGNVELALNETGIIHLSSQCKITIDKRIIGGKLIGESAVIESKVKTISKDFFQVPNNKFVSPSAFHYKNKFYDSLIFPKDETPPTMRPWKTYHHTWDIYIYIIIILTTVLIILALVIFCVCACKH